MTRSFDSLQWLPCAILSSLVVFAASGSDASFSKVEKQFRELPMEARRLTGPLFWLHGAESKEHLEMYVGKVYEGGNGSFTPESRPHNDWLGPGWWRDLDICLAAAKKNDLEMWIFDEKWWPSQAVGGKVPPRYAAKELAATTQEVKGPQTVEQDGYNGEKFVAAIAGRVAADGKIDGSTLIDLASRVKQGKLRWEAPEGQWRVMKFTYTQAPGLIQQGGRQLTVDGASKDCVDWFIQTVYQPHYDRYKNEFGKTIKGFFYDEPETPGDWGTELRSILDEWKVDWKKAYVAYKFELSGDDHIAARFQYLDAFAEAWGRTMYGGVTDWCRKRGVQSIGHFMEHSNLYQDRKFSGGDMMRLQGYSDMGGIDAVFSQFVMGKRDTSDRPCWQTPKLGSSVSHVYGKEKDISMVEIFGARGQDLTYPEMKWWTDHMQVSGVNFLIPHSFNPKAPYDRDCPPYFYNNGFEPRWPLYRVFADYTSRLTVMLTGGSHVCPVALLIPGQSAHVGKHILSEQVSEVMQDALFDCDWMPYSVFEDKTSLKGKAINLRAEAYKVLVVPAVEVVPYGTLAKAKEFFDRGGVVMAHGFLPVKSATIGKDTADIAALRQAIWGDPKPGTAICKTSHAGGKSFLLPARPTVEQIRQAMAAAGIQPTFEVIDGKTDDWLHVLHRVKEGRDVFFVANQIHQGEPRTFKFRIKADGFPECWDAMRNEIRSLPFKRVDKHVEVEMTMEPNESVLLVFQAKNRQLPPRLGPALQPAKSVALVRQPVSDPPPPILEAEGKLAAAFRGCSWIWHAEPKADVSAPSGTRYFRKQFNVRDDAKIKSATFFGTADNSFELFVNGTPAGQGDSSPEGWRNPVALDVTKMIQKGTNQLAIKASNGAIEGNKANPAGLVGALVVEFSEGPALKVRVDQSWKASETQADGWMQLSFDDQGWSQAVRSVAYGRAPWGNLAQNVTLSPVTADPFLGKCEISQSDLAKCRVYLEVEELQPELAARVAVNGSDAGGFIGKPARMDVTRHIKPGVNVVRMDPFSGQSAKLVFYRDK